MCAPTPYRLLLTVAAAVASTAIAARATGTVLRNFTHNSHLLSPIDNIHSFPGRQPVIAEFELIWRR